MNQLFRSIAAVIALLLPTTVHSAIVHVSTVYPHQFAFMGDPDLLYFAPGNQGMLWFKNGETSSPGNLEPWQDVYFDSVWMDLHSSDYDLQLVDKKTTAASQYWQRMEGFLNSCYVSGDAPAWRVNDEFVSAFAADASIADDVTSQAGKFAEYGLPGPMLIFDVTKWSADAKKLHGHITGELPGWAIGCHVTPGNVEDIPRRIWSFIIADEEIIPETYRGQSSTSWLRSLYGQIPAMLSPLQPDFQRDMVWLGCGAAGIWFRPMEEPGTVANRHGAIHMRATTTYLNRFGNHLIRLNSQPGHASLNFSLEAVGFAWAGVLKSGAGAAQLPLPAEFSGKVTSRSWFNPATDENIMRPLTRLAGPTVTAAPPNDNLWVYALTLTNTPADTDTTVSTIRELPF